MGSIHSFPLVRAKAGTQGRKKQLHSRLRGNERSVAQ